MIASHLGLASPYPVVLAIDDLLVVRLAYRVNGGQAARGIDARRVLRWRAIVNHLKGDEIR